MMSFIQYVMLREGLLPDLPAVPGKPRINTTPLINRRRPRIARPRMARVARGKVARARMATIARAAVA